MIEETALRILALELATKAHREAVRSRDWDRLPPMVRGMVEGADGYVPAVIRGAQ